MYSTLVTKLRKKDGIVVFNYDVYIGPAAYNCHWDLEGSMWCNPYQFRKAGKVKEHLERYKLEVTDRQEPKMLSMLSRLEGKILGCICPNIMCCHGHLLAKLAQGEKDLKNIFDETSLSIDARPVMFFKGRNVPYQTAISTLPLQLKSNTMMRRHHWISLLICIKLLQQ